ncbi:hypothetical protein MRX96_006338 [Rhipicephalus microplus]
MPLMKLNQFVAKLNAQHATVNTQLLAMNQQIEDLEQMKEHLQLPERVDTPAPVTSVPTIVNRGNKIKSPTLEQKGCTVSRAPPTPWHDHDYASRAQRQTHRLEMELQWLQKKVR